MYNFNLINSNMENNNNLNNSNNNLNNNKTTTSNNNNFFQLKNNNNNNNILNNTTNNNNNHCNMEWSNEICLRLIDEYRNFPALWDQTSPFYKNKLKRKESWCRLAERFGCSKAEVERKMNVLLTQYRREKHKMLMQVYKGELKCSRWYAFKKFSFMENGLRPKKQQRALQLLNAMQLRLGYNPLQSVHNAPSIQNLATWHSTNDILNQSDNNNSLSITNDTEQSCPPSVQDLSINHINDTGQMHHNNPIQQQSANSTIEDEMVEINVDPLNLLSGHHLNTQSFKHANNNNNNNSNNNNIKQRTESLNYHHHDVKEEVFDSSSIDNDDHHHHNSFQRNIDRSNNIHHNNINNSNQNQNDVDDDDEEDEEHYSILDFRRNRYSSDTSPKKKINFHTTQTTTTTTDQSTTYPHHFHHSTSSLTEQQQQQQQKDEKNDRWSELLQQVPTTAASSSTEKPSTTKLFQNYDSQSMSLADKDDCDFVGLNVALKLRSMEESQRIIAEKLISDVLFYGQFKELDRTANVCPKKDNSG